MTATLEKVYQRLRDHYGPPPQDSERTPLAALIGAVLISNANEKNVAEVLDNLREAGLLDAERLGRLPPDELEEHVGPAGHARMKAPKLHNVLKLLTERYDGSPERMFGMPLDELRAELLAINGVGPETADRILLKAGNLPSFVVDLATHRVLKRHGWIDFEADYDAVKEHVESSLEREPALYRELHALLARVGREHCGKTPKCDGCPLANLLPDGGPREPEAW